MQPLAAGPLEPLDHHTRCALLAAVDDLSVAARRAIERAADIDGDAIGRALAIYDVLSDAITRIATVR